MNNLEQVLAQKAMQEQMRRQAVEQIVNTCAIEYFTALVKDADPETITSLSLREYAQEAKELALKTGPFLAEAFGLCRIKEDL